MSDLVDRLRQSLQSAMRDRDRVAVSALRSALAALDNATAQPVDAAHLRGVAIEQSAVGVGTTEAPRREVTETAAVGLVQAEIADRLTLAAQLTSPTHTDRAARLRAEAGVLQRMLKS